MLVLVPLGMLQKQHPDIALSIKTRQAIRNVLNSLRDGIHELLLDGILEEAEGHKLEKVQRLLKKKVILKFINSNSDDFFLISTCCVCRPYITVVVRRPFITVVILR